VEKFVDETNNLGFSSLLWIYTTLREIARIQHILRNTTISFNLKVFRIVITPMCREGFGYLGKVRKFQQPQNRVKQHTVITRKLRNSKKILRIKFNFKKFINHETQHLCSVKRPISQKSVW